MAYSSFSESIAGPGSTLDDVRMVIGFDEPAGAEVDPEPRAGAAKWCGQVYDETGSRFQFEGFETQKAMIDWLQGPVGLAQDAITIA